MLARQFADRGALLLHQSLENAAPGWVRKSGERSIYAQYMILRNLAKCAAVNTHVNPAHARRFTNDLPASIANGQNII